MSASESPFNRLGRAVETDRLQRVELHGGPRQTAWSIAHRELGEWRRWADIAELNALEDVFDLLGREHPGQTSLITSEGDDTSDDTGIVVELLTATPELAGDAFIDVEDVEPGVFELRLRAPGEDAGGEVAVVREADFFDGQGDSVRVRRTLRSAAERFAVFIDLDIDALLMLWLFRPLALRCAPEATRTELVMPGRELRAGRGE